ncbi:MAG: fibronectin/fibrinogen-binding protein [Syntrophomonadaceae bacterium]|nr:fibronectin/fibrinogen-binding protein [Syntrophomonadaceae bacterium]
MPFDGLTIRAVTAELNQALVNARIDKIFQPERNELAISMRQAGTGNQCRLLISADAKWSRIHLEDNKKVNPANPPSFCMLLRKYLEGGKIKNVRQIDFERIIHITIEALDDFREWKEKILICEFMGRHSNIILVNPENDLIIDAIHRYSSEVREVMPGKPYVKPPEQGKLNPLITTQEEFSSRVWNLGKNSLLGSALFQVFSGVSPAASKEISLAAGLDPLLPVEECGIYELDSLFSFFNKCLKELDAGLSEPTLIYRNGSLSDYFPFNFHAKHNEDLSMNQVCSYFYFSKWQALQMDSIRSKYQRLIKDFLDKANKKRFHQEGDLQNAYKNEKYKIWGELLTSYAHTISKGDTQATVHNYYTDSPETIELDARFLPIQNAQRYFHIYNKSRRAILILEKLLEQNAAEIEYLESVSVSLSQAESLTEIAEIADELAKEGYIKRKGQKAGKKIEKEHSLPRRYLSSDGFEMLVGRNNRQNDMLTLKLSDRNDLWLHTKNIPGAHVILRLDKNIRSIDQVPEKTLEEAAALAAYFSKARQSDKVPVDYTFRYNVKKPGGAKPGMVIYDNYWTVMADPQSQSFLGGILNV